MGDSLHTFFHDTLQAERYSSGDFGICPRVYCDDTRLLPAGVSDLPGLHAVKLFCPNCADLYYPINARYHGVDGCAWGTTFPHLFFKTFPSLFFPVYKPPAAASSAVAPSPDEFGDWARTEEGSLVKVHVPRVYGFRLHASSAAAPKKTQLRLSASCFSYFGGQGGGGHLTQR